MNGDIDPIEAARNPWVGWVIAIAHGGRYLGRLSAFDGRHILSPVYELNVQFVKTDEGIGPVHHCIPVLALSSWTQLTLPDDALVHPLGRCTPHERKCLMQAAQQAQEMLDALKTSQSTIARARLVKP